MKKIDLNELDRKQPFKAPDGYFEELPSVIQSKAVDSDRKARPWELPVVRWIAVPAMIIAVVVFSVLPNDENNDPDQLLAEVSTEELVAYLESSEMSTADLLEMIDEPNGLFDDTDMDILGEGLTDDDMELLLDNYDVLL